VKILFIDTFIAEKLKGNPAAVCITNKTITAETALSFAKEFNFPVTAVVEYTQQDQKLFPIRYFTPTNEIPACGHATLASAKAIAEIFSTNDPSFKTVENIILQTAVDNDLVTMTYPKYELKKFDPPSALLKSLQIDKYNSIGLCTELETVFIELEDRQLLRTLQPDFAKLTASCNTIIEVVITSLSDNDNYDFLLRSFCPWIGIDEDPVTGSVHSILAGFWSSKLNKKKLKAFQPSQRGGEVFVTAFSDKVQIVGRANIVSEKEVSL
jgi:PhzF family phenazine biosynthesis protein